MEIKRKDEYTLHNSLVTVNIISDIEWEDIVVFKSKARLHQNINNIEDVDIPTYREIKDYLIKGET